MVFQSPELALRIRVAVGDMWAALGFLIPSSLSNWLSSCDSIEPPRSMWVVNWPASTPSVAAAPGSGAGQSHPMVMRIQKGTSLVIEKGTTLIQE